jgi:glutaredoxin 3
VKQVEIYTSPLCGFCHAAKRLLTSKGVEFSEVDIAVQPERRAEMMQRANGGRTVPQIFIGDEHVGGCDDLFALEHAGKLDGVLAA